MTPHSRRHLHLRARLPIGCAAVIALAALGACSSGQQQSTDKKPLPVVDVVTLKPQTVTLTTSLPGRTAAFRIAQVRPQVSGIILKRSFVEGSTVKKGQQLYLIDPAAYQAAYDSAKAALQNAKAALSLAKLKVQRYAPLVQSHAISALQYDTAKATEKQDEAQVASAKAALESARINLHYTKVKSPIRGRTGRSLVTEGALVTANQSQALTTVQQLDPIYVDATQPVGTLLRLQREYASGELEHVGKQQAKVELTLNDGIDYATAGKLQFSEVTVDKNTGSVTLRAKFPNPKHLLLPGMFVHLKINEGVRKNALLVPQQGITHASSGKATALIVGKDDTIRQVTVSAERAIGNKWLVSKGLAPGDRLVVKGFQFVRPGDKVKVRQAKLNDKAPPPQSTSSAAEAS